MDDMDDFECDDFDKTLKVIVVGNGNVGKTSMTTRYAKGRYTGNYKKTIGVDFMEKRLELRDLGETVNLMIWDTAGQEEFGALTSRYYKGAGAVIYVFSTTDRDSFEDLPKWQRKVEEECGRISQVLVQNKIDLIDDAAMSRAEVEDMADFMRIRLFRSCVQDNVNVKEVFEYLCRQYLKYGKHGGSDDALQAVADISTLSEAAASASLKASQPSPSYERSWRGGRDQSGASDSSDGRRPSSATSSPSRPRDRDRGRDRRDRGMEDDWSQQRDRDRNYRGRDDGRDRDSRRERRVSSGERRRNGQRENEYYDDDDDDDIVQEDRHRCDHGRDRDAPRDRDRDRGRGYDRDSSRERDRDRDRRDRDRDRERGRDAGRRRDKNTEEEENWVRDRDRGSERSRERERGRNRETERSRERERERGRRKEHVLEENSNEMEERESTRTSSADKKKKERKEKEREQPKEPEMKDDEEFKPRQNVEVSAATTEATIEHTATEDKTAVDDPDQNAQRRTVRQGSNSMRESEATGKDRMKTSSKQVSEQAPEASEAKKASGKATLRAQLREGNDSDSDHSEAGSKARRGDQSDAASGAGAAGGDRGKTSTAVSESGRIQPSKRRTNGKKTNPILHKMSKFVYG